MNAKTEMIMLSGGRLVPRQYVDDLLRLSVVESKSKDVKALIAAGANVNTNDHFGETPLMKAVAYGDTASVEMLISAGADVNAKSSSGSTALSFSGNSPIAQILRNAGARS